MAVNKVVYGGETVIDLTGDTVTADSLVTGTKAHDKSGASIVGTNPYEKAATDEEVATQADLISQITTVLEGKAAPIVPEPVLQSKTVTPSTTAVTVKPDSGYDGLSQVTVSAIKTATQATPSITVSSAGKITAKATQTAGYVVYGTKTATKQLTTQSAQTITPGTSNKTISSGRYLTGTQTIKGDANLVAGNIKSGVSIFGVTGTYEGSSSGGGSGGSMETCTVTASELEGTATYSDGTQITTDETSFYLGTPISVAKNSLLWFDGGIAGVGDLMIDGNAELVYLSVSKFLVAVYGDCTIGTDGAPF